MKRHGFSLYEWHWHEAPFIWYSGIMLNGIKIMGINCGQLEYVEEEMYKWIWAIRAVRHQNERIDVPYTHEQVFIPLFLSKDQQELLDDIAELDVWKTNAQESLIIRMRVLQRLDGVDISSNDIPFKERADEYKNVLFNAVNCAIRETGGQEELDSVIPLGSIGYDSPIHIFGGTPSPSVSGFETESYMCLSLSTKLVALDVIGTIQIEVVKALDEMIAHRLERQMSVMKIK